jgi:hypothetical protein
MICAAISVALMRCAAKAGDDGAQSTSSASLITSSVRSRRNALFGLQLVAERRFSTKASGGELGPVLRRLFCRSG